MKGRDYVYILNCDMSDKEEECRRADAKHNLVNHYRHIRMKQKENEFLDTVVVDYERYFETIRRENDQQYKRLRGLLEYIEQTKREMDVANHLLREIKYDQEELLREMDEVKRDIDNNTPNAIFES